MNHDKRKDEWIINPFLINILDIKKQIHYLWETYDRRLYPIIDIVKKSKKIKILELVLVLGMIYYGLLNLAMKFMELM